MHSWLLASPGVCSQAASSDTAACISRIQDHRVLSGNGRHGLPLLREAGNQGLCMLGRTTCSCSLQGRRHPAGCGGGR